MYDYLIVGAGLTGAVVAHELTKQNKKCLVVDRRNHVAGNIYTYELEGITVHKYGAHIFHTDNQDVENYIKQFAKFNRFTNSPIASYKGKLYNLPFNMNTFYQLWGTKTPEETMQKIEAERALYKNDNPKNLEEYVLSLVGREFYETLIKGYTEKQWGRSATELDPSIIKRIPVRFTYDNNYFTDSFQGIPEGGYTQIVEKMLDCIEVRLNTQYTKELGTLAKTIIYTGPVDEFFNFKYGSLEYRGLRFDTKVLPISNFQGNAVFNYTEREVPYTRIIEHKHFIFGKQEKTVVTYEYPSDWKFGDEPYYPINNTRNTDLHKRYLQEAPSNVIFAGRLGSYKYFDMDDAIESALNLVRSLCK